MKDAVKNRFDAFSRPLEGRVYHMYRDVKGKVTTGLGNLLEDAAAASNLSFKHGGVGPKADAADIVQAFGDVMAERPGLQVLQSGKDAYGIKTDLRLDNQDVDALVATTLTRFDNDNALRFKVGGNPASYADYTNFWADAQLGLLSMQWPGHFNDFVNFQSAVRAGHWFEAARQCYFDSMGNTGIIARNRANRWLFSVAGRLERFGGDPEDLHFGPQDATGVNKVFLFKGGQCVRYDWDLDTVDSGLLLNPFHLPSPFDTGVDAAFNGYGGEKEPGYFGKTYFVKADQYVRYDWDTDTIDLGPLPLTNWGLTGTFAQGIDAAVNGQAGYSGLLYFFKGDQYVSYDWTLEKIVRPPSSLADGWDLPAPFDSGVDAVVSGEGHFLNKLYFIKADKYVRFTWGPKYAQDGVVKWVKDGWAGTQPLGFDYGMRAPVNPPGREFTKA